MMRGKAMKHSMDGVYVFLLFAVFAGCILLVLLFGAGSYEKLVDRDRSAYNERTGMQYLAARIRHADSADGICVGSFSDMDDRSADDINVLYLPFVGEDGPVPGFYTEIYYYDGYIREVLCAADSGLSPEDGNEIMPAQGLSIEKEQNLITFSVTSEDGRSQTINLMIRSGGNQNEGN